MAQDSGIRSVAEMEDALRERVQAGARRYRGAIMRYLVRPPLSLKAKYAAFLIDFARQADHMIDILGRASERLPGSPLGAVLRAHQKDERGRTQLMFSDLRRLGYPQEAWPSRAISTGDVALRSYGTTLSYERPVAVLGMLLTFIGVAAEISPTIVRLLTVGGVPREAMRWLLAREGSDAATFAELCRLVAEKVGDARDQAAVLEAVEVSGELLSMGAAARPPL